MFQLNQFDHPNYYKLETVIDHASPHTSHPPSFPQKIIVHIRSETCLKILIVRYIIVLFKMETIQNSSEESHNSHDFFSGLIENRPSKICSVIFSILGSLLTSLIIYAIIWYEKNGSDLNRTMNNRLFVSCWFLLMFWYIVPQQIDTIRYITGPLPKPVCHFSVFMKFFVTMNTIVLVDISFIIRYLTIFWLNNPAGLNNEFWALFFNVWATLISFLTMFVLNFLPGKDFPDLWI